MSGYLDNLLLSEGSEAVWMEANKYNQSSLDPK